MELRDRVVLVNKPLHSDALALLEAEVTVLAAFEATRREILDLLPSVQGMVLGVGFTMGPEELDQAEDVEIIGRHGVGLDNIDLVAASARGIPVSYTPYGPTQSTAEHTLMLILATARRLAQLDRAVRSGEFTVRDRLDAMGHELHRKVLGVVGFGRIGRQVAAMCRDALDMTVLVHDPFVSAEMVKDWGAQYFESLTELVSRADIVTVHVPLGTKTHKLINADIIQAMKPGAILVNTSRGPIVDEIALIEALLRGHIGGAGLDVYDPQPPPASSILLQLDQVVLTPHVASFTHEGRRRMGMTVARDILRALNGQRPEYLANPEVWPQRRRLFE